jgi:hypothetical protein
MFQITGRMLFPKLGRDQQRNKVRIPVASSMAIVFGCCVVVVAILLMDKR